MKPTRVVFSIVMSCFIAGLAWRAWFPRAVATPLQTSQPRIVGPAVMLRLQREGALVWDLRSSGRVIPGARRVRIDAADKVLCAGRDVVLLGAPQKVGVTAQELCAPSKAVYIVPDNLLEAEDLGGVRQWTPARLKARNSRVRVIDVSEADEFAHARIAGSRRVAWERIISGDRSFASSRDDTFVFT